MEFTDNINIKQFRSLISPKDLRAELPATPEAISLVAQSRRSIQKILIGESKQCMVIVGPCSLHDRQATLSYAGKLKTLQDQIGHTLLIVMRAYGQSMTDGCIDWKETEVLIRHIADTQSDAISKT